MRIDFDWDSSEATINSTKHSVTFEEAMTVFRDPLNLSIFDTDHSVDEERWITLGLTSSGNLLVVVHTWIDVNSDYARVRIISARRPTRNEARRYHKSQIP
jgi:uncharacterized DUF497 family protein